MRYYKTAQCDYDGEVLIVETKMIETVSIPEKLYNMLRKTPPKRVLIERVCKDSHRMGTTHILHKFEMNVDEFVANLETATRKMTYNSSYPYFITKIRM